MKFGKVFLYLANLVFVSSIAFASPGNPDYLCRDLPKETSGFRLAKIKDTANSKIYFLNDDHTNGSECPDSGKSECQAKAYLLPGDLVVVSRVYKNWICSAYKNQFGSTTQGWLPLAAIESEPISEVNQRELAWFGKWRDGKNWIQIDYAMEGGDIQINGEAFWQGYPGNVHVASIRGFVTPQGRSFVYDEGACFLKAYLIEPYLIVADNVDCGGVNVTFTGIYSK